MNCRVCLSSGFENRLCTQCGYIRLSDDREIEDKKAEIQKVLYERYTDAKDTLDNHTLTTERLEKEIEAINVSNRRMDEVLDMVDVIPQLRREVDHLNGRIKGLERYRQNKESILSNAFLNFTRERKIDVQFQLPKIRLIAIDFEFQEVPDLLFKLKEANSQTSWLIHSSRFQRDSMGNYYYDFSKKRRSGIYKVNCIINHLKGDLPIPYEFVNDNFEGSFSV